MTSVRTRIRFWLGYWLPAWVHAVLAPRPVLQSVRQPRVLAVLLPEHLGDVVMTEPLLRAMRLGYPEARLIVAVRPLLSAFVAECPHVSEVLQWKPGAAEARSLAARLRAAGCDLVVVPRADPDFGWAAVVAMLSRAPRRIALTDESGGWGSIRRIQCRPFFTECVRASADEPHEVRRRLSIGRALHLPDVDASPVSWVAVVDSKRSVALISSAPDGAIPVAFGIGASTGARRWPPERFAKVIDTLSKRAPIFPVLIASPEERDLVSEVVRKAHCPVHFLENPTLLESARLLAGCRVFVGNDSGPAHIAASAGNRVLVVSAHASESKGVHENDPAKVRPLGGEVVVVRPVTAAGPGCRHGCNEARPHCILGISVGDVVEPALRLLAGSKAERDAS
jgi:ADP-heptose:LPS heptosyltransferase